MQKRLNISVHIVALGILLDLLMTCQQLWLMAEEEVFHIKQEWVLALCSGKTPTEVITFCLLIILCAVTIAPCGQEVWCLLADYISWGKWHWMIPATQKKALKLLCRVAQSRTRRLQWVWRSSLMDTCWVSLQVGTVTRGYILF